MNAYTKALEPISLEEFNEKIKSLDIQRISTAKEEAELEAPQSWEDRKGYAEYCGYDTANGMICCNMTTMVVLVF